jgi:hypothetical protein
MAEWIYRAIAKRADWAATDEALRDHGFLCRPAHARKNKRTGVHRLALRVSEVKPDDRIHVAFSWEHGGETILEGIGCFEILDTPHPDLGDRVTCGKGSRLSLFTVRPGSPLDQMLAGTTYQRDPLLNVFTGWHVREVEMREIPFTKDLFPGQHTLWEWPRASGAAGTPAPVRPKAPPPAIPAAASLVPPAGVVTLPGSGTALGVDWSGSAQAGKKVWAARIAFGGPAGNRLDFVRRPFPPGLDAAGVAARFAGWLRGESFDVAGLDFCFGVARQHTLQGLPTAGPPALGPWLATHYLTPEGFKAALGRELKRETDRARSSPFAPTNLRMYRQTYWGIQALAGVADPILPWSPAGGRAVVEVLPAHVVSRLCPGCRYKGRTPHARAERQRLFGVLRAACRLQVSTGDEDAMLGDSEGDALDAVLAAVAAGAGQVGGFGGVPAGVAASGEGWIYSVH